ncbi:MAG: glycosyltransferase family 39 protein, partial [Lacunisphaera sp.]|nr:glycosyltransferase family 39 protein [Lacunisphaera sp.]
MPAGPPHDPARRERRIIGGLLALLVAFHLWGALVAWSSLNLPGGEFRQAQTAISTWFIQQEGNFSPAYPTPVLGKPWSIPMEFPLYQWTVAGLSAVTGWPLTQTGRGVSLACFYLTLPALWLLLGRLGLTRPQRAVGLGLVLTCPLYIYYARAFLIETMALMFSAWFLVAFLRAVEGRSRRWLVLANLCGIGAGLVKVTTFMLFLLPAGLVAATWLWQARPTRGAPGAGRCAGLAGWIAAATAAPFLATLAWIRFADGVKRLNPSARFLESGNLTGFNFGTAETRFSAETLVQHWQNITSAVVWPPVLALAVGLALTVSRRRWRPLLLCLGCYLVVLALFPTLYAVHEYYAVANAVFLLAALGVALAGLWDTRLPRAVVAAVLLGVGAAQAGLYLRGYYPGQKGISPGGSGLTAVLREITGPDEVLVVAGDDWSSITPYYAQRRALMIRHGLQDQTEYLQAAFATLADERVGAMVLQGPLRTNYQFRDRLLAAFELDPRPVCTWRDATVYVPVEQRIRIIRQLGPQAFDEVRLAPGADLPAPGALGGEWRQLADLTPEERGRFATMSPQPVGFFSSFGPGLEM